jgi:hypothetical protein
MYNKCSKKEKAAQRINPKIRKQKRKKHQNRVNRNKRRLIQNKALLFTVYSR